MPFVFADLAMAQQADLRDPSGSLTGLLDLVRQGANQWDARLRGYATTLFWLLAAIQFVWTFFPLVFRQTDLGEIVGELIRFILVIGFFYALLLYAKDWGGAVVASFRQAGAQAAGLGGTGIRPGDILDVAVQLAKTMGNVDTANPLTALAVGLASLLVLLFFSFIAAFMALTIIESYVVINAAVLFTGFGGSQWTRPFALAIARYAVAVGAKLFVLTLIINLIINAAKTWQAAYNSDDASMWTMVGLALACAYLCKKVPELVAGMISGASLGGGSFGGLAAAGAAGAAAAMATTTAPATGGAQNRAGGSTGAAPGSGSLAESINASIMGRQPMDRQPRAEPASGGAASPRAGVAVDGEATHKAADPDAEGGNTGDPANFTPKAADDPASISAQADSSDDAPQATGQAGQQASRQTGSAAQANGDAGRPGSAHHPAPVALRAQGVLAALSVPGMESASTPTPGAASPVADSSSGSGSSGSGSGSGSSGSGGGGGAVTDQSANTATQAADRTIPSAQAPVTAAQTGATSGAAPNAAPSVTPNATPNATPGVTSGVTPSAQPDVIPGASGAAAPADSKVEKP